MSPKFISRLVRPHRVAVVGASGRAGSLGYSTYNNVRNNSVIPGGAVPVNPRYETVLGDRCYPRRPAAKRLAATIPGKACITGVIITPVIQALEAGHRVEQAPGHVRP
jgi:acyl-CoA synthetase (NDP forming)